MPLDMPNWAVYLCIASACIAILMVPSGIAKPTVHLLVHSDGAKLIGLVVAAIGFGAILLTYTSILVDLQDRDDERISRNLDRLLQRAPGETGKARAFAALLDSGTYVDGMDLSCKAIGNFDDAGYRCNQPPSFDGLFYNGADTHIYNIKFHGDNFNTVVVSNLFFHGADFRDSFILYMNTYRVLLDGSFDGTLIDYSEMTNTKIDIVPGAGWPEIRRSNISNSIIPWLGSLPDNALSSLYFWADAPPYRTDPDYGVLYARDAAAAAKPRPPGEDPIYGTTILSKMHACIPPISPGGINLPPKGELVPLPRRQMIKRVQGTDQILCEDTTVDAAMRRYPSAYAIHPPRVEITKPNPTPPRELTPIAEPW